MEFRNSVFYDNNNNIHLFYNYCCCYCYLLLLPYDYFLNQLLLHHNRIRPFSNTSVFAQVPYWGSPRLTHTVLSSEGDATRRTAASHFLISHFGRRVRQM